MATQRRGSAPRGDGSLAAICTLIERSTLDRKSKLDSTGRVCYELKNDPLLLDSFPMDRLMKAMRRLVCDSDTSTRAGALRALRYAISSSASIKHFVDLNLPVFVVRSLEREQKHLAERVQALKVVRRVMEIDAAQMPTGLVASLTAIAGHKDDNMRRVCLETLRELALLNVEVVAEANGTKILVDAILEPSFQDLADSLLMTLLLILNEPSTRRFIEPFVDSQVLLAPFTDTDLPAGNERRQRWMASRNAIVTMMRSWTGMVVLTSNPQGLQSLIQLLVRPVGEDVQKAVLSTICEIFYKKTSFDKSAADAAADTPALPVSLSSAEQLPLAVNHNLLDNYTVIILLAMIHCGILEALVTLGTGPSRALAEPAIDLLADILRMASRLLPDQHCASLLALPRLVSSTSLTTTTTMSLGDHAKSLLERLQREKSIRASEMLGELANAVGANSGSIATRGVSLVSYGGSGVNGVQLASELLRDTNRPSNLLALQQIAGVMDDSTFKDMLHNRSRVLTDKNYKNWNWDIISEMLEGPLTNPQRLSEAMKTKFFKRLSGFFRCDQGNKGYFSNLYWIPDHVPYLRPACQMYTLLLNHPEGLLFLKTDRRGQLLTEISSALELEARPEAAIVESHIGVLKARMFSPDYVSRRMLREYFTLLGLMSSSKEGLKMMEQSNLFQRLYVMGTTKGHDFLCRLILANLDYSVDGSSRKLLQSWMMEGSKALRLYATCLLRALLRSEVADFDKWGIDALVTQLTQEEEVAKAALSVLEEAAETPACLLAMILKRPMKLIQLKDKRAERDKMPNEWREVLRFVADLSNHITQKEAHASLNKMRSSKPELFEEPVLLMYVHALLEKYSYRLALRQFVLNAFDRATLTDEVLDTLRIEDREEQGNQTRQRVPTGRELRRRRSSPSIPSFTASVQSLNAAMQATSGVSRMSSMQNGLNTGGNMGDHRSTMRLNAHNDPIDRTVLLKRNRKRSAFSEKTIVVGAPEAAV
ncbi:Protein required for meiosis [Phytophthora cinnamomi]|uniref:Protein required for meiosis n=1 Tax=Phytophthora cinnamomi TaxID=4785 RepID=UPI00355AA3F2|nr:Protein required for meiosis [Phytophthora cinnamomi]